MYKSSVKVFALHSEHDIVCLADGVARFSVSRLPDMSDGVRNAMRTLLRNPSTSCPSLVKFERNLRKLKGGIGIRVLHYRDRDRVDLDPKILVSSNIQIFPKFLGECFYGKYFRKLE